MCIVGRHGGVTARDDPRQFGDEAVAIAAEIVVGNGQTAVRGRLVARVGDMGVVIGSRVPATAVGVMEDAVVAQIACIKEDGCGGPAAVPETVSAEAALQTYMSDLWPFPLRCGEDWTLVDPRLVDVTTIQLMRNGVRGVVTIAGPAPAGEVEACLDNAIADLEDDPSNQDVAILEEEDREPSEQDHRDGAFAVYAYTRCGRRGARALRELPRARRR